jgi:hypothetical protein
MDVYQSGVQTCSVMWEVLTQLSNMECEVFSGTELADSGDLQGESALPSTASSYPARH